MQQILKVHYVETQAALRLGIYQLLHNEETRYLVNTLAAQAE